LNNASNAIITVSTFIELQVGSTVKMATHFGNFANIKHVRQR